MSPRLGVRARLFLISIGVIGIIAASSGTYLYGVLIDWTEGRIQQELLDHARAAGSVAESQPGALPAGLAERFGHASGTRITFISLDGEVLQDTAGAAHYGPHGDRPEVMAARAGGVGTAIRASATVGVDMLYVAVPYGEPKPVGIVRASVPLNELEDVKNRALLLLGIAGFVGLAVAVFMSATASHIVSEELRTLVDSATELARGGRKRLPEAGGREVRFLAGSINRMADSLETTVAELAEQRDRFQTALGSIGEAIVVVDPDHRILVVNEAASELFDIDATSVGARLSEIMPHSVLDELVRRGLTEEATAEMEVSPGGGRPRRLEARAVPLRGGAGALIVASDVTEMRRLETVRRDFVSNVSHELRTPVSIIRANSETLLGGALQDARRAPVFIEAIHRNAERLANLIADLLDLARIEAGHYVLHPTELRPAVVFSSVVQALTGVAEQRRITVQVDVPGDLVAFADEKALEQIAANLVDNAIKYGPEGTRVDIVGEQRGDRVRLEVRDDGPGIARQHRERIFERFYRVDPGRSRAVGGTGLGLSIVKHLAEGMYGAVGVEARQPTGSVFWVELPASDTREQAA